MSGIVFYRTAQLETLRYPSRLSCRDSQTDQATRGPRFRTFSARPERLVEVIEGNPGNIPIVIDETQKVPSLLDVVHHLIETKK